MNFGTIAFLVMCVGVIACLWALLGKSSSYDVYDEDD